MNVSKALLSAGIISIISVAGLATNAMAWHPKGVITKKVENVTTGSVLSDADTAAQATAAKPGDTLKYVIEVRNAGEPDNRGYNDMAKTVLTDTLPAGVELVSNPAQRQITENLGTIKPGKSVVKEYLVKVVADTEGAIKNTACFTGNSTANDNPQQGCNPAYINITIPEVPQTPQAPVTPEAPETPAPKPEVPAELPHTGTTGNIFIAAAVIGLASYIAHRYATSRRELISALLNK